MVTIRIPDWYVDLKNADSKLSYVYEKAKKVLKETSVEVYICAALGLAVAAGVSYKIESNREKTIPLGFSEVKQLSQENMTPVTKYLTSANDIPMKIFECWNKSHEGVKNDVEAFAEELENVMGSAYSSTEFSESLKGMNKQSEEALEELKDFTNIAKKLGYVNQKFDAAWYDRHVDNYRTETYLDTETYTDSEGKTQVQTVVKTRQVYEDTDHYYDYYKPEGEEASRSLDALVREQPTLKNIAIRKTPQVSLEGEELVRKSRKKGSKLTEEQILEIANKWNTGATITVNLPTVYDNWDNLKTDANNWRTAKNTAKSASYTTYSSSDPGPKEFQIAETALYHGRESLLYTKEFLRGIEYVQEKAPVLEELIRDYIYAVNYKEKGDPKKLRKEILYTAREWYSTNFKNGLDVYPFRAYMIFLFGFLGLGLGIGAGIGIDKLGEKYNLWAKKEINP